MSGEAEWGRELVIKLSEALPVLLDAKHIILGLILGYKPHMASMIIIIKKRKVRN